LKQLHAALAQPDLFTGRLLSLSIREINQKILKLPYLLLALLPESQGQFFEFWFLQSHFFHILINLKDEHVNHAHIMLN
jgi:hypothetical protein